MTKNRTGTVAVVGGGAGGLYCAAHAALLARQRGTVLSIHIFEKNRTVGRKLSITGSSQCNITHDASPQEMAEHYWEHTREMRALLSRHTPLDTMNFYRNHGLRLTIREDGKVFPSSFDARDVIKTLTDILTGLDVHIHLNTPVSTLTHERDSFDLTLEQGDHFSADAVVIATGGFTYPETGSTGDGYRFAQELSHSVITPRLSLSPLKVTGKFSSSLSGITIDEVSVTVGGKVRDSGALLFTHQGLSGPAILHSTRFMNPQDTIRVSFVQIQEKEMTEFIRDLCTREGKKQLITLLLETNLPRRLLEFILSSNGMDGTRKGAEIGKKDMLRISRDICSMQFTVSLQGMNSRAMVSAGGVSLEDIDLKTMESNKHTNLFFCGEVLDLDGETGGYNLQIAWSTAAIAAEKCVTRLCPPTPIIHQIP